ATADDSATSTTPRPTVSWDLSPPSSSDTPPPSTSTSTSTSTTPPPPPTTPEKAAPPRTPTVTAKPNAFGQLSFYSARDNNPPGSRQIAFTNVLHRQAGGTGTFEDPITMAAGNGQMFLGTKVYVPFLQRYFILEDQCPDCANGHIQLWTGEETDSGITACERSLTRSGSYQVNPPNGLPVIPGDLYQNGRCFKP
ncbi:hypothetical protein ACFQ1S_22815, partial [Kibdelosporangium lantanae]